MQRHPTLAVKLRAAHFRATKTAGYLDTNTLGAGALGTLQALAHRPAERHTGTELFGDALGDKLGLGLRVLHLQDVELDLLGRQLLEVGANALGLCAATPDHDAWASGVDVHPNPVTGALDLDARHAGAVERRAQQGADLGILCHEVAVTLAWFRAVREPARHMVGGDPEAKTVRIDFLTHYFFPAFLAACATSASLGVASTTVMWLVRFRIWNARP